MRKIALALFLVLCLAFCSFPVQAQLQFELLRPPLIEARLKSFALTNNQRAEILKKLFKDSGCSGDMLTEQAVPHVNQPNLICVLPGDDDAMILVGAHFDMADEGDGVVDNWSGAVLLPSLYQALGRRSHRHTYVFIAFSGEEKGLLGSEFYVKKLTSEQKARIHAMVNMDSLGLSPTKIWVSHSDQELVSVAVNVANALKSPLLGVNVEKVGSSDSDSFLQKKIPTASFHSVTQETLAILHSPQDNIRAIHLDEYFQTYRLLTGYLTYLDSYLFRPKEERTAKKKKD